MRRVGVGLILVVWDGDPVDDHEDAEDGRIDKVAHALHGERQHHLHIQIKIRFVYCFSAIFFDVFPHSVTKSCPQRKKEFSQSSVS